MRAVIRFRSGSVGGRATYRLVPARRPILFLTRVAAVPGSHARATFEVLRLSHNIAPFVVAILSTLQRLSAKPLEIVDWIMPPLQQPVPRWSRHPGGRRDPP